MKKKIIIGVVAVVVIALVVGAVMLCRAPELNMDGTYEALDGSTLTISGDTFSCSDETYSGTVKRVALSAEYIPYNLPQAEADLYTQVDATLENASGNFVVALRDEIDAKVVAIWSAEDKEFENVQYYFSDIEFAESYID